MSEPVAAPCNGEDDAGVAREGLKLFPGVDVPEVDGTSGTAGEESPAAIRSETQGADFAQTGGLIKQQLARGGFIEAHMAIAVASGEACAIG